MAFIYFTPVSITLILIVVGLGFTRRILFVHGINKQIESNNRATIISTINMISSLIRSICYPLIGNLVMLNLNITLFSIGIIIFLMGIFTKVKKQYLH